MSVAAMVRQLVPLLLALSCASSAWGKLCDPGTFWSREAETCVPCSVCARDEVLAFPCQPFQDTLCEAPRRVPPPPVTEEEAHRARLAEERVRANLQHANESLQVEMTRMESLVHEWQLAIFITSILMTFALVLSFLSLLFCKARRAIKKGVEDYSHLILNREQEHRDANDQSSLAFADFDTIKIGRRSLDSPYSDLTSPRRSDTVPRAQSSATSVAYNMLPQQQV